MTKKFKEAAALWKTEKRPAVRPSSYAVYVTILNTYLLPAFGDCRKISEERLRAFAAHLSERRLRPATVRSIFLVLKMITRFAESRCGWEHTTWGRLPAAGDDGGPRRPGLFTPAQERRLLEYLRGNCTPEGTGILIGLCTGMRIGEICGLTWEDVDLQRRLLNVGRTVQRLYLRDGEERLCGVVTGPPKSLSSRRQVPIAAELLPRLRALKRLFPAGAYVLSGTQEPMEPRTLRQRYYRILEGLNLPPVRFHGLRHSFATRCVESRCDYKTLSAILGHSGIGTTMNLYVHPDEAAKRRCIDRMVRRLGLPEEGLGETGD